MSAQRANGFACVRFSSTNYAESNHSDNSKYQVVFCCGRAAASFVTSPRDLVTHRHMKVERFEVPLGK